MILNDGIRKNEQGKYEFDYTQDLEHDLLNLCNSTLRVKNTKDLTYFFAYQFNPNADANEIKDFRKRFKHSYNDTLFFYEDDVFDFVEIGMLRMDKYKKLTDFDIVFMTDFGYGESAGVMALLDSLMLEYTNGAFLDVKLVKETYDNIKFDIDKAVDALMQTKRYAVRKVAVKAAKDIEKRFNQLKASGEMFKIKQYMPVAGRAGFYDFLKFDTEDHRETFMSMADGSEALICDDFITSGSTVREMKRYLNSINPNVHLTVFVLVDQLRDY